jgi:polyhydroxyalkanoate synthase
MTLMAVSLDGTDSTTALYATPQILAASKVAAEAKGVTEARDMALGFAMMRPKEAIWNFWVNNYLMGNSPPAFDVFYWSSDATRLTAKFYSDLMGMTVEGRLLRPGAMTVLGVPVDISKIDCDKFVLAGTTDHITPWRGGYKAARQFGGDTQFTLAASGHIQSILSPPPGHPKSKFFVNPNKVESPDDWLKQARAEKGSWWPLWKEWLTERSGGQRAASQSCGNARYKPIAAAPGEYVHG